MQDSPSPSPKVAVIGGGPAGLTAAYELIRGGGPAPTVYEASDHLGGIARTENHQGYRADIGGHRFFTKVQQVEDLWHEVMGDDFITVPRMSRIYYRGKFYSYPLQAFNALSNLGLKESLHIIASYCKWKLFPSPVEETFEQWVTNRFGGRLYYHFFRTYTEKVWGVPCTEIRADWAAQRIKDLSLKKAVLNAFFGSHKTTSLIEEFKYPPLGPGQMWERFGELIENAGGTVAMEAPVIKVRRDGNRVTSIDVKDRTQPDAPAKTIEADQFVSSMAITHLIKALDPPPPAEVFEAAANLKYRDFLIVNLVIDHADPFPDNWIYVHSPDVQVGRIQNFRAWSQVMVPREDHASIGMEYFCQKDDGLWSSSDEDLVALAAKELEQLGLAPAASVVDGFVIRQPMAYPVYDAVYRENLDIVKDWLITLDNLQTVGRNGQHRYNNQDHSMLSAMLAARNILGETHDIWNVNVERSYHEEFVTKKDAPQNGAAAPAPSSAGQPATQASFEASTPYRNAS